MEQKQISATRQETTDYEMFVPCDLQPNEVGYLKVTRTEKPREKQDFA